MLRFISLALFASLVSAEYPFRDCGHKEIQSLKLSTCNTAPCTLHKGKDVTFNVVFTANQNSKTAYLLMSAKVGLFSVHIPGIDPDLCHKHLSCPLKKGRIYNLKYTLTVPTTAPSATADLTAKLVGDQGNLACGIIHGAIKK